MEASTDPGGKNAPKQQPHITMKWNLRVGCAALHGCHFLVSLLIWDILQILRNCKVARILPRVADTAKNDRSAILRARYACSHRPVYMFLQATQAYILLFQVLRIRASNIGILG